MLLHGHGDDPAALLDRFAPALGGAQIATPTGPVRTADGLPAWFISAPGDVAASGSGGLADAIAALADDLSSLPLLGSERGGLVDLPVQVIGYSQGAATALAWAFGRTDSTRPRIDRVVTVAGWLAAEPDLTWDFASAAGRTTTLLIHGEDDEVVDAQMGRSAARVLERAGVDARFEAVAGDHAVTDEMVDLAVAFLRT